MTFGRVFWVVGLAVMSACVHAADAPLMQPPAEWVKPAVLDPIPSKLAKDAPTAVLLQDNQVRFQPEGAAFYHEVAIKAQTPQGLAAIGSVTIPWDPATQRLIIHKLKVLRAGQEIDYLATGPGFLTLRRETKLEAATLDGTLTATTQIEGLEVGDIMDLAYTVEHTDPIMKGHVQADFPLNLGPVHHARLRALWPSTMQVIWRRLAHAPDMTVHTKGDWTEATLDREDPADPIPPKGAPPRYLRGPELQFGNFASWAEVSALLSVEFAEAEVFKPGSLLEAEVKSIADRYPDPKARAEAALTLVQDKIRYVLLALDGGGLKPAAADLTWTRRFADCKGKTVVLLALLHALGIEAEPALVSSAAGDGLDERLPLLSSFDHVLVRATIDGKIYWLDGTRIGDRSLAKVHAPDVHWALPIRPAGGGLIKVEPEDFTEPATDISVRFDATSGLTLPAAAHGEMVMRGDAAIALNMQLSNLPPANLETVLKEFWRQRYDYVEITSTAAQFDSAAQEERLTMEGIATLDWQTGGGYEVSDVEYHRFDFQRQRGPDEDAPFAVVFPRFDHHLDTILLPNNGRGFSYFGESLDEVQAGVHFRRGVSIAGGVFTAETTAHAESREATRAETEAAARRLTDLSKRAVRVLPPRNGMATTAQERAILKSSKPSTAEEYLARGNAFLDEHKYDEALADFDKAVGLAPNSSIAWADRAIAWAWKGDAGEVQTDAAEALRLNPKEIVAFRARGVVAGRQGRWLDAVTAFNDALAIDPRDLFSLMRRAWAFLRVFDPASALKDCDAGLAIEPGNNVLVGYQGDALIQLDRVEEAAALARSVVARSGQDPDGLILAARLLRQSGNNEEAWAAIDKAVSLKPTVDTLLARANLHAFDEFDAGLADAYKALALDGQSKEAVLVLAKLNYHARNYAEALKWASQAVQRDPGDVGMLALVGGLQHVLGREGEAAAAFDRAHQVAGDDSSKLNSLCWGEATMNYNLPEALANCDAALKIKPDAPQILDSRAFVLLRLGRDEEALVEYDAALNTRASAAASLLGRSIAERRTGRIEAADRDRTAAIHKEKNVVEWFRLYGVDS